MPSTSSVLLPLLQPAGQTRNVVSRAGAACKAADGAGEEPAFLFFLSFFIFFYFSLFSLLSHLPGAAASPRRLHFSFCFSSYFCLLFLFFLFVLIFAFLFAFFFLIFSLYFSSYFLFLFFLCPFFLLFFLVFIFDSPFLFFVFLFVLLFYHPRSNLFPYYPTARRPFIFFSSAANLSYSLQPLLGSSKKKKISAKESTGVRWPPGSERAAGGKAEGQDGMN